LAAAATLGAATLGAATLGAAALGAATLGAATLGAAALGAAVPPDEQAVATMDVITNAMANRWSDAVFCIVWSPCLCVTHEVPRELAHEEGALAGQAQMGTLTAPRRIRWFRIPSALLHDGHLGWVLGRTLAAASTRDRVRPGREVSRADVARRGVYLKAGRRAFRGPDPGSRLVLAGCSPPCYRSRYR
jgi:ABC-type amino acid transport substrate-binding protein